MLRYFLFKTLFYPLSAKYSPLPEGDRRDRGEIPCDSGEVPVQLLVVPRAVHLNLLRPPLAALVHALVISAPEHKQPVQISIPKQGRIFCNISLWIETNPKPEARNQYRRVSGP